MRTSPRSPAPEPADASTPLPGPEVMALLPVSPETRAALRVLIVDDERTLRESCASVLTLAGYNITVCGRGQEALELLKRTRFDAVLLDLYMSQVPGMELLRACLEANRDTIVIVMTGTQAWPQASRRCARGLGTTCRSHFPPLTCRSWSGGLPTP